MMKKFVKYSPNKISDKEVELELLKSKEEINRFNKSISYYHGNIDRATAEKLLRDFCTNSNTLQSALDGLFLIRKCSASPEDFSLSMYAKSNFYHYRIGHSIDAYYVLDDGPIIHGLDELIKHYQFDPHGLPCRLNLAFVPNGVLPSNSRIIGNTNPLHIAVSCVSEVNKVRMILKSQNRPDINEKDDNGRTALHIACEYDNINAVEELVQANVLPNIRAKDGSTALHTAAEFGSINCLVHLLKFSRANPMERNMTNNWVPLHEAASRDHYTCVNALLQHGLPDKPRTADNQTPLDLALEARHSKTISILKYFTPPEPRLKQNEFLHDSKVTREIAKYLLEMFRNEQGVYLVRRTLRNEKVLVLSMMWNNEFFNYEICVREEPSVAMIDPSRYFFIDDGPYFRSLAHLIEHYTKYEDGLPGVLKRNAEPALLQHLNISPTVKSNSLLKTTTNKPLIIQQQTMNNGMISSMPNSLSSSNSSLSQKMNNQNIDQQLRTNGSNNSSGDMNGFKSSDALTKAHLFKSRTLLNDQKRRSASQLNKRLSKILPNEIHLQASIGEGEFGTVYKGTYNGKQVAVKKLKDCTASNDFLREADIMGTLNNPCILKIFGLVQEKSSLMMVQELMICSILEKLWQSPNEVTESHLKLWASQIALGMQHMEEQKIVHRDLAARNVLLASMSQIKISDFGLSRSTDSFTNAYTQRTEGKIPIKWYAPESIEHLKFTSKSDVWSYGITLWEMFSYGEQPYGNMNGSDVYSFIQSGSRLHKPNDCPKNTHKIMLKCWEWHEDRRPTFRELNLAFQNDTDYQKTLPLLKVLR